MLAVGVRQCGGYLLTTVGCLMIEVCLLLLLRQSSCREVCLLRMRIGTWERVESQGTGASAVEQTDRQADEQTRDKGREREVEQCSYRRLRFPAGAVYVGL